MGKSEHDDEIGIGDEDLPEDLQPSEDNPLAEGLEPGETVGDLLDDGKPAEEDADSDRDDEPDDTADTAERDDT